jgi:hypothetical protein
MMFVLRSPWAGLVSMIPNVFPIFVIFGALGWLGIKVDIGIMMTASVALGVAVDDTIHYLTWFRRGIAQGLSRKAAAMQAYERCGVAMVQTTLIGGLGLAVFATSTFTPTQQFGYLMITMLCAALVGDLLLLPAIVVGPLGRFFGPAEGAEAAVAPLPAAAFADDDVDAANQPDVVETTHAAPVAPTDAPETLRAAETARTDAAPREPAAPPRIAGIFAEERQAISDGPHAALHAKLRRLRRESAQDSHP